MTHGLIDVLSDGPFRYIHNAETGELLATLFKEPSGRFREEDGGEKALTLRQWKAIFARSESVRNPNTSHL